MDDYDVELGSDPEVTGVEEDPLAMGEDVLEKLLLLLYTSE